MWVFGLWIFWIGRIGSAIRCLWGIFRRFCWVRFWICIRRRWLNGLCRFCRSSSRLGGGLGRRGCIRLWSARFGRCKRKMIWVCWSRRGIGGSSHRGRSGNAPCRRRKNCRRCPKLSSLAFGSWNLFICVRIWFFLLGFDVGWMGEIRSYFFGWRGV